MTPLVTVGRVASMANTSRAMQLVARYETLNTEMETLKKQIADELGFRVDWQAVAAAKPSGPATNGAKLSRPQSKPSKPVRKTPAQPIAVQVAALLDKGPHTYPELWTKLGVENKKAIRSTVDKKTVAGVYRRNDKTGEYSIAPAKPAKSTKKAKAKPAQPTAGKTVVRNDKTPQADKPTGLQTELTV